MVFNSDPRSEKKEEAYFKLRSSSEETQVDPSTDADEPVDKQIQDLREEIDKDLTSLSSILENIPGLLLSYIHRSLLSEYTKVFKTLSHGDGVWFVAHGWEAKILLANMRAVGYGTQRSSAEIFLPKVRNWIYNTQKYFIRFQKQLSQSFVAKFFCLNILEIFP